MSEKKVVGIVGMPGSGKSVAAEVGKGLGFSIVVMGDVVREEVVRRGLELTPENVGRVMLEIREEGGDAVVAKKCVEKAAEVEGRRIMIEGIRSLAEVEEFKRHFPNFKLLATYASPETRFRRIFERGRNDDSTNRRVFAERDERELKVGIGSAIAMADHVIINEGTIVEFEMRIRDFLEGYLRE